MTSNEIAVRIKNVSHQFGEAEIVAFAREFDPQPMHLDKEAGKASLLGGMAASGWHTCAIAMRLMVDKHVARSASLGSPGLDNIRWHKPVRPGDTITYTFAVHNTGNLTLNSIAVTDTKVSPISCPVTTLLPGQTTTCTAPAYVILQTDIDNGQVQNQATVNALTATNAPVTDLSDPTTPGPGANSAPGSRDAA